MITNKDVENATGLTRQGVLYRISQMQISGIEIKIRYVRGKVGSIRVYTDEELKAIVDYKARKPGRKRVL